MHCCLKERNQKTSSFFSPALLSNVIREEDSLPNSGYIVRPPKNHRDGATLRPTEVPIGTVNNE